MEVSDHMQDGQWRTMRHQGGITRGAAWEDIDRGAAAPNAVIAHAEPSTPQVLVVWQILQSLLAAVRAVAASDEAALVRTWCLQALEDLAFGPQEGAELASEAGPHGDFGSLAGGQRRKSGHEETAANAILTVRQVEILRRLREGERPKEIAHALNIAESTARSHIRDAIERLGVHGALAAMNEAERCGLL